jgi:hypothetical protein
MAFHVEWRLLGRDGGVVDSGEVNEACDGEQAALKTMDDAAGPCTLAAARSWALR